MKRGLVHISLTACLIFLLSSSMSIAVEIPQTGWSLWYVDSQELIYLGGMPAENAFDGNINTVWFTEYRSATPLHPHEIQIDLGESYDISGLRYSPFQGHSGYGRIEEYEFYVSTDGYDWGDPVAEGIFENDEEEKEVVFSQKAGRYVRLRALSEVHDDPWTSVAEINIIAETSSPSIEILQPKNFHLQPSDDLHVEVQAVLDDIIHSGWKVKFTLSREDDVDQRELIDEEPPFEVTFEDLERAEYEIEATLVDELGTEYPGFPTQDRVVQVGIGDYYVAIGASMVFGIGDDDTSNNVSWDSRNTFGGYEPILNNLLTDAFGFPHTIVNEGKSGHQSKDGLEVLPKIIEKHPHAQNFLILYGTNDSFELMVPSGVGLNSTDPGYDESYKDNIQGLVTTLLEAGKQPILAKLPIALGKCSECAPYPDPSTADRNILIQEYNQVIDELIADNGIETTPPDFYTYFSSHPEEFSDRIHPNGAGYKSMAQLYYMTLTRSLLIPQDDWRLWYVDSEELSFEGGAPAVNAFDGDPNTFWFTQYQPDSPLPPHEIQIDLGGSYDISGFRYLPSQGGWEPAQIEDYEFSVSSNSDDWGQPVAEGVFSNDLTEKEVKFSSETVRFICLKALSEINGGPWTSLAELNILGNFVSGNKSPTAVAEADPTTGTIPLTVDLTGSHSFDDDGIILDYFWDFGDGSTSNLSDPTHVYQSTGTYRPELTVTDHDNIADTHQVTITANQPVNTPPTADITRPSDGAFFAPGANISYEGNGTDAEEGLLPSSSFTWTGISVSTGQTRVFGVGVKSGILPAPTQEGDYTIRLEVEDSEGSIGIDEILISVSTDPPGNQPPTAVAEADPDSGVPPLTVNFTGSDSSDEDGTIVDYLWDFGDGSTSNQADPTHVYQSSGTYTSILTLMDDDDLTGTAQVTITVTQTPNEAPTATITQPGNGSSFPVGQAIGFSGTGTDPEDGVLSETVFTWEAGIVGQSLQPLASGVKSGSGVAPIAGDIIVRLTVRDGEGLTDSDEVRITATP